MKRQPRAKTMLPDIKQLIVTRALEDRDRDRRQLAYDLRAVIKQQFPQEIAPTVTTLMKRISEARSQLPDPLDDPWHMGTLVRYPVSPESIPHILKLQQQHRYQKISIRQAKWIDYLHRLVKDATMLFNISLNYAFFEKIAAISKTQFNTKEYDNLLDNKDKQGQLVQMFKQKQGLIKWDNRRKVFKQVTGAQLGTYIVGYIFRGNTVSFLASNKEEIEYGTRHDFLNMVKENPGDFKDDNIDFENLPDQNFILMCKEPFILANEEDICEAL